MSFLLQAELVTDDAEHKSSEDPVRWGPQAAVTVSVRWRQAQEDPVGLDDVTFRPGLWFPCAPAHRGGRCPLQSRLQANAAASLRAALMFQHASGLSEGTIDES